MDSSGRSRHHRGDDELDDQKAPQHGGELEAENWDMELEERIQHLSSQRAESWRGTAGSLQQGCCRGRARSRSRGQIPTQRERARDQRKQAGHRNMSEQTGGSRAGRRTAGSGASHSPERQPKHRSEEPRNPEVQGPGDGGCGGQGLSGPVPGGRERGRSQGSTAAPARGRGAQLDAGRRSRRRPPEERGQEGGEGQVHPQHQQGQQAKPGGALKRAAAGPSAIPPATGSSPAPVAAGGEGSAEAGRVSQQKAAARSRSSPPSASGCSHRAVNTSLVPEAPCPGRRCPGRPAAPAVAPDGPRRPMSWAEKPSAPHRRLPPGRGTRDSTELLQQRICGARCSRMRPLVQDRDPPRRGRPAPMIGWTGRRCARCGRSPSSSRR